MVTTHYSGYMLVYWELICWVYLRSQQNKKKKAIENPDQPKPGFGWESESLDLYFKYKNLDIICVISRPVLRFTQSAHTEQEKASFPPSPRDRKS